MKGEQRLLRCMRLTMLLYSGQSYNAFQLADLLEVSRRTIFRDLALLEQSGIPVDFNDQTRAYRISPAFSTPVPRLNSEELGLLLVALDLLTLSDQSNQATRTTAEFARAKLLKGCPETLRQEALAHAQGALPGAARQQQPDAVQKVRLFHAPHPSCVHPS